MPSAYYTGRCVVVSYSAYHQLWYDNNLVANFRTFRDAVTYQLREFA
jgi:hypothetical protein